MSLLSLPKSWNLLFSHYDSYMLCIRLFIYKIHTYDFIVSKALKIINVSFYIFINQIYTKLKGNALALPFDMKYRKYTPEEKIGYYHSRSNHQSGVSDTYKPIFCCNCREAALSITTCPKGVFPLFFTVLIINASKDAPNPIPRYLSST